MPSDRPWSDTDRELVAEAIRDSEWSRGRLRIEHASDAVLDALTAAGWRPITRARGYHVNGRVYAPQDVMIVWEGTDAR